MRDYKKPVRFLFSSLLQFSAIRLMATGSCRVPVHEFIIGLAELTTEKSA
jgi:hypothetical protein